jgi:hypothetical protein
LVWAALTVECPQVQDSVAVKVFVTHNPEDLDAYYGRALPDLQAIATVMLNPFDRDLSSAELIDAAAGCDVIVAHRATGGDAAVFEALPDLKAFLRCAVDISTIDVAAASSCGVLVALPRALFDLLAAALRRLAVFFVAFRFATRLGPAFFFPAFFALRRWAMVSPDRATSDQRTSWHAATGSCIPRGSRRSWARRTSTFGRCPS